MWSNTTIKQAFRLKLGGIVRLYATYVHTNFRGIPSSSVRERVSEYTWCPRIDNLLYLPHYLKQLISNIMPTVYHHIYGFSMFNTLTKALHETVIIIQVISSFFVFNKPLEIPSYIPLFSQCTTRTIIG